MNHNIPLIDLSHINDIVIKNLDFKGFLQKNSFIMGEEVDKFEKNMKNYLQEPYFLSVSSGTDALYLILNSLNAKKGDEVITTALTFIATSEAIVKNGLNPVFCDIDDNFLMNVELVERCITDTTVAILNVDLFGIPNNLKKLKEISDKYDLVLINDSAQSFGAKIDGELTTKYADFSAFSFFPTKNIGGFGDGGGVSLKNSENFKKIESLRVHGKNFSDYNLIGGNYRLDSFQAFVLNYKISFFEGVWSFKRSLTDKYLKFFQTIDKNIISTPDISEKIDDLSLSLFSIRVKNGKREQFQKYLNNLGIESRVYYEKPLYSYSIFDKFHKNLENSEKICSEIVSIPFFYGITESQISYLFQSITKFVNEQ
ncbi:aminotransferase class V-fold PLP-dependent enzyme [bacterium]|nr:aminotransferase class V-fold PLP-dependent enzyme [bacterium]